MKIIWDKSKNEWLITNRGVSFDKIADKILNNDYYEILDNPTREGQSYFILGIEHYTWVVPFRISGDDEIVLKTAFPSRKFNKRYGEKMKPIELTAEEKQIENDIDLLKPVSNKKRQKIENIITEARKNKSISLRISSHDLEQLKEKANDEGIPYQTLINSILHKYVTKQFYDKDQMLRSLKLMSKA